MVNGSPLVSIIICNYNYGHFLKDAVDSALTQTYKNVEIVVVDDGSSDNSRKIIDSYGRAVIPVLKGNGGQASAFNDAFTVSKGEIIIFLDADDMLLPTLIEKAVKLFNLPEVVKVHWPLLRTDANGVPSGKVVPPHPLAEGNLLQRLIDCGPALFCGTLYSPPTSGSGWSRYFLEKIFPLPEAEFKTGGIDYYLMVLSPVYGIVCSLNDALGCYRVHGSNDTLKPVNEYLKIFFTWFEMSCTSLSRHLNNIGKNIDPESWPRDSWYHKIDKSIQEITKVVPEKAPFILVDDNLLSLQNDINGRHRFHLIEINGQYGGTPVNDDDAIAHLERNAKNGASSIIFAWTAFWWLDHYKELYNYLVEKYRCLLKNDRLVIFDLQQKTRSINLN